MAEPENHTLRLLREFRNDFKGFQNDTSKNFVRLEERFDRIDERLAGMAQAMLGESVLGRYTVAEVEQRLDAMEKRLSALEKRRS